MTLDTRTNFRKFVDALLDRYFYLVVDDRPLARTSTTDRRQLDHMPAIERRDGRTADRRGSVVLNSASRPAGGPNGRGINDTINAIVGSPKVYPPTTPLVEWATPLTLDDARAVRSAIQRVADDENATLKACCEGAALEIWHDMNLPEPIGQSARNRLAAIIYKHMRNGREL